MKLDDERGVPRRLRVRSGLVPAGCVGMISRVLVFCLAVAVSGPARLRAAEAIPDDKCLECHSQKDLTKDLPGGKTRSLFVDAKEVAASVHGKTTCASCHHDIADGHPDDGVAPKAVDCASCHERATASYGMSAHAKARKSGSAEAPDCKDCHGRHDVTSPNSPESPLHFTKQAETCGGCHTQQADDVSRSVHGRAAAKGVREAPTCTACHAEHRISTLKGAGRAQQVGETCSRCHESERMNTKFGLPPDRVKTFLESYHGLALKGGSANAANCASCHGYHRILPSQDPDSSIHKSHLAATCGKCHPGAGENFINDPVHGRDSSSGSVGTVTNHWVKTLYILLIAVVIGGMLLHNFLSWLRAIRLLRAARGATVERMNLHQRIQHFVLVISFVSLALSGFALKYPDSWLAWMFGSDEVIRRWLHRAAGVMMLAGGLWHLGYAVTTRDGRRLVRDLLPCRKDLSDLAGNLLYFVGKRSTRPSFGRFGYAEKLEYWAVVWGTFLIGLTGIMIWCQVDMTRWMPRWVIEVAVTIHYYEAILACSAIVVWHFYHVLFAPGTYPMNFAWWDGRVTKEWQEEEHPLDHPEPSPSDTSPEEDAPEPPDPSK